MENIDNIGKNSLEALSRDNLNARSKKKLAVEIVCAVISLSCLGVGLIYTYIYKGAYSIVPQLLYFLGFLIEGVPVIITAIKGIFSRNLKNAMEILVAIAIIACVFNKDLILALLIPLILNAVHLLEEGKSNRVVAVQNSKLMDFDITEALEMKKPFDLDMYHIANEISI
jgi:cation transport ATPase